MSTVLFVCYVERFIYFRLDVARDRKHRVPSEDRTPYTFAIDLARQVCWKLKHVEVPTYAMLLSFFVSIFSKSCSRIQSKVFSASFGRWANHVYSLRTHFFWNLPLLNKVCYISARGSWNKIDFSQSKLNEQKNQKHIKIVWNSKVR